MSYLCLIWAPSADYYIDRWGRHFTSFGRFGSGGDIENSRARSAIPIPLAPGSRLRFYRVRVAHNTRLTPISVSVEAGVTLQQS